MTNTDGIVDEDGKIDIVRLSDNGKTLSSYYYGTNGSFVQENTLITDKNDGKRQNIVSTNSMNAMKFFKFAANSDVEYGFSKFNNYKTKTSFCVVSTNQSNNSISISSEIEIYVLTFLPNTYLSESWHTHPGPYDKYSGWPAYPSGFDQYGIPNEDNKGDRANFMFFHTKFPTQSPNYMYIFIPSTNMIVKYNNYEYEVL